jgi:hypothetical protein
LADPGLAELDTEDRRLMIDLHRGVGLAAGRDGAMPRPRFEDRAA